LFVGGWVMGAAACGHGLTVRGARPGGRGYGEAPPPAWDGGLGPAGVSRSLRLLVAGWRAPWPPGRTPGARARPGPPVTASSSRCARLRSGPSRNS